MINVEARLPGPIQILLNAQSAVTEKVKTHWRGFLLAAVVPALVAGALLVWIIEAYWAATPFVAGQWGVLIAGGVVILGLTCLAISRMLHMAMGQSPVSQSIRGLACGVEDYRFMLAGFGVLMTALVVLFLEAQSHGFILSAFIAPGSDAIARPVLALTHMGFILGLAYLLGRIAIFLPATAQGAQFEPIALWQATEGHAAVLFIVAVAVPMGVVGLVLGPFLLAYGALPWPAPGVFNEAQNLVYHARSHLYAIGFAAFIAFLTGWMLMAAGLAAAWEALVERGAINSGTMSPS